MIFCPDLEDVSDEDIAECLPDCGMVLAHRNGSIQKSRRFIPDRKHDPVFSNLELPREVLVGYGNEIPPVFSSPMMCLRC